MATVRTSFSQAIVASFGTITATAGAVAKAVDAATDSVDMLTTYVQRAKEQQRITHLVQDVNWKRNLIIDAAREQERIETELKKEYASDPARSQKFQELVSELEARVNEAAA